MNMRHSLAMSVFLIMVLSPWRTSATPDCSWPVAGFTAWPATWSSGRWIVAVDSWVSLNGQWPNSFDYDSPITWGWVFTSGSGGVLNDPAGNGYVYVKWTSVGDKTVMVTVTDMDNTICSAPDDCCEQHSTSWQGHFTVVQVGRIQYLDPDTGWKDCPSPLYVCTGTTVTFRAMLDPDVSVWPPGKPVWGGTSGASGTGPTTSVQFGNPSTNLTDYKTVTAECGNTATANVIVCDFTGILTPAVCFTGRTYDTYGVAEDMNLTASITPAGVTASQVGGLRWSYYGDDGVLSNVMVSSGSASYHVGTCPDAYIYLNLTVDAGLSRGIFKPYVRNKVQPLGSNTLKSTCIWHFTNSFSIGLLTDFYLWPTNVSFGNIGFKEGSTTATMSGWFVGRVGADHAEWSTWYAVSDGDISTGCMVMLPNGDKLEGGPIWNAQPYTAGTFHWDIPWLYRDHVTGVQKQFDYAPSDFTVDATGRATVKKKLVGPYSNTHSSPTQDYCP